MKAIFKSDWFYQDKNIGSKIKSPIELFVGISKSLKINLFDNYRSFFFLEKLLGQQLYKPPGVQGWSIGKAWISNSTLVFRLKLLAFLLNEEKSFMQAKSLPEEAKFKKDLNRFRKIRINFSPLKPIYRNSDKKKLGEYLLQTPVPLSQLSQVELKEVTKEIMGLPEYQLC